MRLIDQSRRERGRAALQGRVRQENLWALAPVVVFFLTTLSGAVEPVQIKIRDLAGVEGVRENPLVGYGMVVGLNAPPPKHQTAFPVQTPPPIPQRIALHISPT